MSGFRATPTDFFRRAAPSSWKGLLAVTPLLKLLSRAAQSIPSALTVTPIPSIWLFTTPHSFSQAFLRGFNIPLGLGKKLGLVSKLGNSSRSLHLCLQTSHCYPDLPSCLQRPARVQIEQPTLCSLLSSSYPFPKGSSIPGYMSLQVTTQIFPHRTIQATILPAFGIRFLHSCCLITNTSHTFWVFATATPCSWEPLYY